MASNEMIGYGLLALLLLAVIFSLVFFKKIRRRYADWRLFHRVGKLGCEVRENVILPDGIDSTVYIDNLVLLPDRILVVSVGRYEGSVFASENIDVWTQVLGKRSYKFANPLLKLEQDIAAVRAHLPKIPVSGILIYASEVDFPKGKPDNVLSEKLALERFGAMRNQAVTPELQSAWATLARIVHAGK